MEKRIILYYSALLAVFISCSAHAMIRSMPAIGGIINNQKDKNIGFIYYQDSLWQNPAHDIMFVGPQEKRFFRHIRKINTITKAWVIKCDGCFSVEILPTKVVVTKIAWGLEEPEATIVDLNSQADEILIEVTGQGVIALEQRILCI